MTQTNDAERPHEFRPIGEPRNPDLPADYCVFIIAGNGYCGQPRDAPIHQVSEVTQHAPDCTFRETIRLASRCICNFPRPRDAAIHQVAKCVNHCIHDLSWMGPDGLCHFNYAVVPAPNARWQETHCGHRCTFAPAEVHPQFGSAKGKVEMSNDFNEPDFAPLPQLTGHRAGCFCKGEDRDPRCDPNAALLPSEPQSVGCDQCYYCCRYGCIDGEPALNCTCPIRNSAPPDQHVAPPQRIWTQLYGPAQGHGITTISAYDRDPREIHGNGKPVYEYLAAAPIQAALMACRVQAKMARGSRVAVRKSDWDALVAAVKGGTK